MSAPATPSAHATGPRRSLWLALALALAIAWGFLAFCTWRLMSGSGGAQLHPVRQELYAAVKRDPALKFDIAAFVGAQVLLHTAVALVVWLLALGVRRAYPHKQVSIHASVAAWSVLVFGAIYLLNAAVFPWSAFSGIHPLTTVNLIGDVTIADAVTMAIAVLIATVLVRASLSFAAVRAQLRRIVAYAAVAVIAVAAMAALDLRPADAVIHDKPHVIIVGIDSLRPDAVGKGYGMGLTPNIDAFVKGGTTFTDATTPLARTYASWMAILTGRHPVRTHVRDNLMDPGVIDVPSTLATRLKSAGYSTLYATDEVRFSNIDQAHGFDRVVGPRMGATDFALTGWGDMPLTNLVANTRIARWLFPNTYANRAAAKTYRPQTFVEWVDDEIDFREPTFFATHVTLPHYPYHWAEDNDTVFGRVTEHPYTYLAGVVAVDRQFGQLMHVLEHRGALENAIVVVLSDHGEALGLPSDNLLHSKAAKEAVGKLPVSVTGHGSSVLSPPQYQVVLAIRRYGAAARAGALAAPRYASAPASLEDIAPTVLSLLDMRYEPEEFDGASLSPQLAAAQAEAAANATRIRFTETGLTTTFMRMGNFSAEANVAEGMRFFAVDPKNSRIVFRRERLGELLAQKERAAFTQEWLLAAIPDTNVRRTKYILVSRAGGVPRVVTYDPETVVDPIFATLWAALHEKFGSELTSAFE